MNESERAASRTENASPSGQLSSDMCMCYFLLARLGEQFFYLVAKILETDINTCCRHAGGTLTFCDSPRLSS